MIIPSLILGYQIIKNIIFKNIYTLPFFYIIFLSTNKVIVAYLEYGSDYFHHMQKQFLSLILFIIILEIIIIYMQGYYGPRFMFGSLCREKNNTIYKSKKELLKEKPNSKNEKCSVCLSPIFDNDKNNIINITEIRINSNEININDNNNDSPQEISGDIRNNNENDINIINIEQKHDANKIKFNKKKCNCKKFKKTLKLIIRKIFWDFYINEAKFVRKYVLLSCGHFFHLECINTWIKDVKKCPFCRQQIPQNEIIIN